ncbi:MAG: peptidoglycan-binding domain-containing protein [Caulobacteraceae bacterium]
MRASKFIVLTLMFVFLLASVVSADSLQNGSKGAEVKRLQQQLKELGYFNGEITGYFGSATEAAVKSFQKKSGISVDGVVGNGTYKELLAQTKAIVGKANFSSKKVTIASRGDIDRKAINPSKDETQTNSNDEVVNEDLQDDNGNALDSNSENSKVEPGEYLDWWDFVRDYFKIGTIAQVIDYRTGYTFNIKRTYGTNHADSETLTKEDTAIMKELWGGEWSWTRRPAIIVINGKRIAASIAGMPHAGRDSAPAGAIIKNRSVGYGTGSNLDKIKGNNMDGHFDVHFLNSRTHGTNRIDPRHQNAVREAAGKL